MCGICGKLTFGGETVDRALVARMASTLHHRGPDDEGLYCAPFIGLGQKRLSIIDLNRSGTAPLANENGTIWIVFNGEIYNFQELRRILQDKGHVFRTGTDTEVIVHAYEQYGIDCLAHLRGMFAFAIWDGTKNLLFAARDRLGKKPFCYTRTSTGLTFGSEIKAITADSSISVAPDFTAIDRYLTYQYVPSPLTAFAGIRRLPAGHYLTCTAKGDLRVESYWTPPEEAPKLACDPGEVQSRIVQELREAVRLRMISDVPIGAFLSGGIDSGAVVALMAGLSDRPVKTFSIGFAEEEFNELPYARMVAERYGTDHREFTVRPNAAEVLPKLVWHYNEPFADSSAIPSYYVSRITREHVTVALSGDGGDESFSGYGRYGEQLAMSRYDGLPMALRALGPALSRGVIDVIPHQRHLARLSRVLYLFGSNLPERYVLQMMTLKPQERRAAYTDRFLSLIADSSCEVGNPAVFPWDPHTDPLDWMMRHDQTFYLPDCLMVKSDIAAMANSLEVRCPFLDHKFMEFASSIPAAWKRRNGAGKLILKEALKPLLPQEVLAKPKSGFGIPLAKWLRQDLADLLRGSLCDDRSLKRGLFKSQFIKTMIEEHMSGARDWSNRLWTFLFLELWFREFVD